MQLGNQVRGDGEDLDARRDRDADEDDLCVEDVFEELLGFTGLLVLAVLFVVVVSLGAAVAVFR